ncbi:MAG: metal-sensitive transcriptional regulator [bacterium]
MTKIIEVDVARNKIINRISRIEGQFRGIRKMIDEQKSCVDVIPQINAVRQAVAMLATELLENDLLCKFDRGERLSKKDFEQIFKSK